MAVSELGGLGLGGLGLGHLGLGHPGLGHLGLGHLGCEEVVRAAEEIAEAVHLRDERAG